MDNVIIPTELTKEAVKKIMDGLLIAAQKDCMSSVPCKECCEEGTCDRISNNLSLAYPLIVEHFKTKPITTDAEKEAAFYRALFFHERPPFVPARVNLSREVWREGLIIGPGALDCDSTNPLDWSGTVRLKKYPRVYLIATEYQPIAWRKNEADK